MGAPGGAVKLHPEVLEATQARVLRATARPLAVRGFRLGGGTGLALVLGHRQSVDFDWFCIQPMGDPMLLAHELRDDGVALQVSREAKGTLHGTVEGVRLSLLEYPYPDLAEPLRFPDHDVVILSFDDIACMKLSAIAQRGSRKDFIDLFVMGTEHRPLPELLELYRKKFDAREITHLLYSLVYFEDAEREPMPKMLRNVGWGEMRTEIERWVRDLATR